MSYEQYWDGDISAHKQYREAHKLQISEMNTAAWLHGRYVYDALCAVSPILRAFSKARRPEKYPEPYDLFEDERKRKEEIEQRKRYERIKEKVAEFADQFNKRRKEVDADG